MPDGKLTYRRGELRWVNLEPGRGAEARKVRSCLIVQNDTGNDAALNVVLGFF